MINIKFALGVFVITYRLLFLANDGWFERPGSGLSFLLFIGFILFVVIASLIPKLAKRHDSTIASVGHNIDKNTHVMCPHCYELFDQRVAQRISEASWYWIICPKCDKRSEDTIHQDCPYWNNWNCNHDPKKRYKCSLPTKAPYKTCALNP